MRPRPGLGRVGRLRAVALASAALLSLLASQGSAGRAAAPRAHAAASYLTGVGDENPEMFNDPLWQQLHTRIARYIVPYDAVTRPYSLTLARRWIEAAEAHHVQVLVAFYHSEYTPATLPSIPLYQKDVRKFVQMFPHVRQYQSWDESNRGNIRGSFASPSASAAARYYQALKRSCPGCTVIGLDILDAANINPTLRYIAEFKHEIGRLKTVMPKIWGLHNYSDVNRLESWRTHTIVAALGGQVWLTETGGLVKFLPSFPNTNGSGLTRASRVTKYMFSLAAAIPRIKRLYIFDWTGGNSTSRFDAGLTDNHHHPRPGYVVVCRQLRGPHCDVTVSHH